MDTFFYNQPDAGLHCEGVRRLWRSRVVPDEPELALSDFMFAMVFDDPNRWPAPERFQRYRLFVSSMALVFYSRGDFNVSFPRANYLAARVLEDAIVLRDKRLLELLPSVLAELHAACWAVPGHGESEHAPFLTLGLMILAFLGQDEAGDPAALAERLIAEEGERHSDAWGPDFLWDVTLYDSCHATWQKLVRAHFPAQHSSESVVLVRDELLKPMRSREDLRARRRRLREGGEGVEPLKA